jgi:hypothetical protein
MTGLAPAHHKLAFSAQVLPSQEARTDEQTKTHTKHGQHTQALGTTTKKRQKSAIIGLSGDVHAAYTHKSRTRRNARTYRQNLKVCLYVRAPMSRNLNAQKKYLLNFASPPFTQKIEKSARPGVTFLTSESPSRHRASCSARLGRSSLSIITISAARLHGATIFKD